MFEYNAKLVRVIDADTFDFEIDLGFSVFVRERIRLADVDAWEKYGEEKEAGLPAMRYVEELFKDSTKIVVSTKKDARGKYGRYIAEIHLVLQDGSSVNLGRHLVEMGHAKVWGD